MNNDELFLNNYLMDLNRKVNSRTFTFQELLLVRDGLIILGPAFHETINNLSVYHRYFSIIEKIDTEIRFYYSNSIFGLIREKINRIIYSMKKQDKFSVDLRYNMFIESLENEETE